MPIAVIDGQITGAGDAPLEVRVRVDDVAVEAPVRPDGSFTALVRMPPGLTAPDPSALLREMPGLVELVQGEDELGEVFRQLGGSAPEGCLDGCTLGLHALAQGDELLGSWAASDGARAWLNATCEVFSSSSGSPVLARRLHLSSALADHSLALRMDLGPSAAPHGATSNLEANPGWSDTLARLWSLCRTPAGSENVIEHPVTSIPRGTKKELRHALEVGDWLPHPKGKFPHRYGVVGRVTWSPGRDHPFTGIFAHGAQGLVRLGSAINNTAYTIPGLALKLPVTGRRSVDIAALYRAEGQGSDGDFFRNALHTHVPPLSRPANTGTIAAELLYRLQLALEHTAADVLRAARRAGGPRRLPVDHLAAVTQDGAAVAAPRAPFELDFVPTADVRAAFVPPPRTGVPRLREQLAKVPAGTLLYRVIGVERDPLLGEERWELGELRLDTELVRSHGGDRHLHFEHFYPPAAS